MRFQKTCLTAFKKFEQRYAADHHLRPPVVKSVQITVFREYLDILDIGIKRSGGFIKTHKLDRLTAARTKGVTPTAKTDPSGVISTAACCFHDHPFLVVPKFLFRDHAFCDKLLIVREYSFTS